MSLASEIAASIQRVLLRVKVDGRLVPEVIEATVSLGFDQANAQATLYCRTRPSWADEGKRVEVWAGYNNDAATAPIFNGELNGFAWEDGPGRVGIDCRDLLARTRMAWQGDDVEEVNIDSAAMVRHILEIYGIPSSAAHIEGSGWELGTINPVTLKKGEIGFSLIQRIDELEGYKTFTDSTGVIRRMRISGTPAAGSAFAIGLAQLIERPRRIRSRDGIQNACIVTGLTIAGITVGGPGVAEASAPNPFIPDPPGFVGPPVQDDLIEDDDTALAIAERIVADNNRRPDGLELQIVGDPRIQPGMTLAVSEDALEVADDTGVWAEHIEHRVGQTFTTSIRTTGGALTAPSTQDPIAAFDVAVFLEAEDTGLTVDPLYVCVADGSSSYDPDGTIASYAWTATVDAGTVTPASGSDPVFRFTIEGAATACTVTLTVTDDDSLEGVLERVIPLSQAGSYVEDLYDADGDAAASSDGEATWQTQTPASGTADNLAEFAADWGQVWGTSTGHIYATFDRLASALVDLGQPHGAVGCTAVWVHEVEVTRLWAGFSDGAVYFGELDIDGESATWTAQGTVPDSPIVELRESYGTLGELRATAGQGYYYSADGGNTWTLFDSGDTAWRMAAGFDQNAYSFLNDDDPLRFEDGHAVTFPTLTPAVRHIRGLTFGWRTQKLYAADDQARLFVSDDTFSTFTQASVDAPSGVNHMHRSGNVDGVIYLATDDGVVKWLPDIDQIFYVRQTAGPVAQIGVGGVHTPIFHSDCVTIHVPTDPGTYTQVFEGDEYGYLITQDLDIWGRITTETTFTATIKTFITFNFNGFSGVTVEAGVETNLYGLSPRNVIGAYDPVTEFDVTFCHLAPE